MQVRMVHCMMNETIQGQVGGLLVRALLVGRD